MTQGCLSFRALSDCDLIHEVMRLAGREQQATAHLVAALAEFDTRRLYLAEGCSSMFVYCTNVLHISDSAAYRRIQAARTATRFPVIFDLLASGDLTVTNVELLSPVLTDENHQALLREARHRPKREVQMLVARLNPRPEPPCIITPLAEDRFKVQCTITGETHDKLRRAQDLLRHVVPNGDVGVVLGRALDALLPALERTKYGKTRRPRQVSMTLRRSRHITRAVRRAVWERDGGQCAFVGPQGRCTETGLLEFHHVRPFAVGGGADVSNIELRCRAHNQYEADVMFGGASLAREAAAAAWGDEGWTGGVPSLRDGAGLEGLCVSSRRIARARPTRERVAERESSPSLEGAG